LQQARPVDDLGAKLQDLERRKDEDSLKISRITSLSLSYQQYIRHARTDHNCFTCGRPFHDTREEEAFVTKQVLFLGPCLSFSSVMFTNECPVSV
jgi:hypothetical protein